MCNDLGCPIPYGKCHCGCGEDACVPRRTNGTLGHVKGEPRPYARGHWFRKPNNYEVRKDGCWIWQGFVDPVTGYGKKGDGYAHRVLYEQHEGTIPEGMELDHLCRVRACVNPEHLEPVLHTVNARRGAQTKLTEDEVRRIRELRSSGVPNMVVAEMFNISRTNVCHITARRSWKEVA